ncbi:MAG: LysR family transcriptional regulator [Bordetella sp.]|nr:LysR family transcriptional regulator [Pseudomonadota bacterium]
MDWTQRLRLRHLQLLLSLARTGNMSQSAQELHTTQPGLSKWLRELEEDIGLPLFERHARGLHPTAHGEALIAHARRIEAQLDTARDDMAALRAGGSGLVVVGTSGASASDTVPLATLKLLQQVPRAQLRLVESTMDLLMNRLAHGELDIVVGRTTSEHHHEQVRAEMLYMEPLHFVARPQHPLFKRAALDWADLMDYRWVVWPRGTPIRNALEAALAEAGHHLPRDHVESNSVAVNLTLLNSSPMIGVASHRTAQRFARLGAMRVLPLRLSGFGSVSMYWNVAGANRAAVAAMLECLRTADSEVDAGVAGEGM